MHAYEPEDLTPEQREWAETANHHHARIQTLLMRIAVSGQQTRSILECETELAALAHKLNYANLQLWKETAQVAERALQCAKAAVSHLATSLSPAALECVITNARYASQALTGMTDAQRRTMLDVREVALAKDIADDCDAEFDNALAWSHWRTKAGVERPARLPLMRVVANDNLAEPDVGDGALATPGEGPGIRPGRRVGPGGPEGRGQQLRARARDRLGPQPMLRLVATFRRNGSSATDMGS